MNSFWPSVNFPAVCALSVLLSAPAGAATIDLIEGIAPGIDAISVQGIIEPDDSGVFFEAAQRADRAVVYLESPGGNVQAGLAIAAEIAFRGFTTLVVDGDGCHSICAVIWVSGARRYMSPQANISVHAAYRMPGNEHDSRALSESGMANAMIGAYLNNVGLSMDAIAYFTMARPDEPMLPITPDIAQRLSIDVIVQDGDHFSPPNDRPTPRGIARYSAAFSGMSARCAGLLNVEPDFFLAQASDVLSVGHTLFGREVFSRLIPEYLEVTRSAMVSQGGIRWCLQTEETLREEGQNGV